MKTLPELNLQNRWWTYQKQRFPLVKYGGLIAIFSGSAICYSALLHHPVSHPSWRLGFSWLLAFINVFCFFLQIRIADEFKDFEDDRRYRPDRPVPSGLIHLQELGIIGGMTAVLQLVLAGVWMPQALPLLGIVWCYFGLMCAEFFVHRWLKAHMTVYMLSHMVILPLIALYATSWDWWMQGEPFLLPIIPLLLTCFLNGMVFEIGRKIRAPEDEQAGVPTYSALWQPTRATLVWLIVMGCTALSAIATAAQIHFALPVGVIVMALWLSAGWLGYRFVTQPSSATADWIDHISGIWTLALYFSLGLLPFIVQQFLI